MSMSMKNVDPLQTVEKLKNRVHKNDAGSTESTKQVSESSNGRRRGGSTQRAAALAALSSAFNSSRNGEKSATKADNRAFRPALNHSSQKAAAVAALSTALSVEPKPPAPAALVSDEKLSITVSGRWTVGYPTVCCPADFRKNERIEQTSKRSTWASEEGFIYTED